MDHYRRKFLFKSLVLLAVPAGFYFSKGKNVGTIQDRALELDEENIVSDSGTYSFPKHPNLNDSIRVKVQNIKQGNYAKIQFQGTPIVSEREDLELDTLSIVKFVFKGNSQGWVLS